MTRLLFSFAATIFALSAVTPVSAQTPMPADLDPAVQQQVQGWVDELSQIHQQLESYQQEALADPTLVAQQEEIAAEIQTAMTSRDPQFEDRMARLQQLEALAMEAQQSADQSTMQEVISEAQGIQQQLLEVQQEVMEAPQIAMMVTEFQVNLEEKMIEIDPEVAELLEEFHSLEAQVAEALQIGQ